MICSLGHPRPPHRSTITFPRSSKGLAGSPHLWGFCPAFREFRHLSEIVEAKSARGKNWHWVTGRSRITRRSKSGGDQPGSTSVPRLAGSLRRGGWPATRNPDPDCGSAFNRADDGPLFRGHQCHRRNPFAKRFSYYAFAAPAWLKPRFSKRETTHARGRTAHLVAPGAASHRAAEGAGSHSVRDAHGRRARADPDRACRRRQQGPGRAADADRAPPCGARRPGARCERDGASTSTLSPATCAPSSTRC